MLKAIYEAIKADTKPDLVFGANGLPYFRQKFEPALDPKPDLLGVRTLTGFADFFTKNVDGQGVPANVVHVVAHNIVTLYSPTHGLFKQRDWFCQAIFEPKGFEFGRYHGLEEFIIALQSQFVQDDTTAAMLKIVGNLESGQVNRFSDDGVTQQVDVRAGIKRLENAPLPNPVTLRPYRTFLEIDQPASLFVFRLRESSSGGMPQCALFEADGGHWKLDAMLSVAEWLKAKLPEGQVILA